MKKEKIKMDKENANITIVLSDLHFGHENCLYETLGFTLDKLCKEINVMNFRYNWKKVFLVINGDMVSGTQIYRNQYLDNLLNKDEDIVVFGSYMIHSIIERIKRATVLPVKTFIVAGNHEGSRKSLAHNFTLAISRRLNSYGHEVRYCSNYLILDIANGFNEEYNICAFHGWGSADYSSASPSLIRELTRFHSQLATDKKIIIKRFTVGHTHWLETGRNVLGIRFDVTGGFQKWEMKMSWRESGMLYYIHTENNDFEVKGVSGLKMQLEETSTQRLHTKNMRYTANILDEAITFEIDRGLLKPRQIEEK